MTLEVATELISAIDAVYLPPVGLQDRVVRSELERIRAGMLPFYELLSGSGESELSQTNEIREAAEKFRSLYMHVSLLHSKTDIPLDIRNTSSQVLDCLRSFTSKLRPLYSEYLEAHLTTLHAEAL